MNKVKIIDIAEVKNGSTPSTKERENYDGDIIWITPKDVSTQNARFIYRGERTITKKGYDSCSTTLIPKGSILLSSRAPIGLLTIAGVECCTNQGFKNLVLSREKVDNIFLYYYLKSRIIEIEALGSGTTFKELSKTNLENFEFNLPSLLTQTAIAKVLSSLDEKIELNQKINQELENLAKTIYEYWFVQNANEKWERKKIADLIKNQKNGDWGKDTKQGNYTEKVTCIRGTDINSLTGNNELKAPERYILEKNNNKFLTDGDFVIEISGGSPTQSTGRMAYILEEMLKGFENPLICSNFCKAISLEDKKYFYYFIFIWKQLYDNGLFFGYEGKTSGIKNFLFDDFVNFYEIAIPPTKLLEKFNKIVSPLFSTIIKNRQENTNLAHLRDFLLPLLMNGQVAVGEKSVEEKAPTKQQTVFKRAVLSAYILDNICEQPTAGRVKFEKMLYLSEYCAKIDLQSTFHRHAAGPYDSKALYSLEKQLKKNKWFEKVFDGKKNNYVRLAKANDYKKYCETIFSVEQRSIIDKLISFFKTAKTEQCEIVATLYGAWNDFLISNIQPTDEQIVNEVLSNWHDEKKRIEHKRWLDGLSWMRRNDIVPIGYGMATK